MGADRRGAARLPFRDGYLPPRARVRPGREVIVVDLSGRGALVEGPWRFRPGSRCDLALALSAGEVTVRAKVTRCYVARLDRGDPVRYRAALAFDGAVAVPEQRGALDGYELLVHEPPKGRQGVADTRAAAGRGPGAGEPLELRPVFGRS
jgi:PilZ domain